MLSGDKPYPKGKYYVMPMFPYPSGDSMHVGHASNYIINDFVARYKKMQGYDVIHPMGFDSFGLPTENYAIKTGKSARQATKDNIVNFKEQIKAINLQFDPEREFATSDPEYYKRTQWIFARLFEHGLAYKKDGLVNRCNGCQTVLANDQVVDGKCERCETVIIQKKHPQRYIKTTALADELIDDLDTIDRPEETKTIQKNWIGRSFGAEIDFEVVQNIQKVHDTNDTLFIICDFDGVLGDTIEHIAETLHRMGHFYHKEYSQLDEAYHHINHYGKNKPHHTKDHMMNEEELLFHYAEVTRLGKEIGKVPIKLHQQFIDNLKRYHCKHLAVVSSGSQEYVKPALKQSGLATTHILCSEDHHSKEEKIKQICKDRGVDHKQVYYITDTLADIYELKDFLGENKLIGTTRGVCNKEELSTELKPTHILDTYDHIIGWFESQWKPTISQGELLITVFTTRPDTLYGVTALVLAPENQIIDDLLSLEKKNELEIFRSEVAKLTSIDRQSTERQKNGMFSGVYVTHPLTNEQIPVWFADYVLMDYATGAVMMVPAHDERDREFAKRYEIAAKWVIYPADSLSSPRPTDDPLLHASLGEGGTSPRPTDDPLLHASLGEGGTSPRPTDDPLLHASLGEGGTSPRPTDDPLLHASLGEGEKYIWQYFGTTHDIVDLAKRLRQKQTKAEDFFWELVKNRGLFGIKFRRQHPFGRYIVDFFSNELNLVIELDGEIHNKRKEYDRERDQTIKSYNVEIMRFTNNEILEYTADVLQKIAFYIQKKYPNKLPSPSETEGGTIRRGVGGEVLGSLKERGPRGEDNPRTDSGYLINSAQFDGLDNSTAKTKITEYLESLGCGRKKTTFRLRDRSISRQRYRGSPIPVYYTFQDNQKVPYFKYTDGDWKFREGENIIVRKTIIAIVKNKSSDEFLMIKWKGLPIISCILGGIEEGESGIQACIREIEEEGGFKNAEYIKKIGGEFHSKFRHPNKKRNQYNIAECYYFEVERKNQIELSAEEQNKHEVIRVDKNQVKELGNNPVNSYYFDILFGEQPKADRYIDRYNAYNPHPDKSKWIPHLIPDEDLPVILPLDLPNYKPAGKSPLEDHPTFKYYSPQKSGIQYTIKDYTDRDIDFVYQEHVREFHTDLWGEKYSKDIVKGWLDKEDCICKIALENKHSIGYMMCFPTNSVANWLQKTFNYNLIKTFSIHNINISSCIWLAETVTIESKRGKGVFSQLLQSIINDTYFLGYAYCGLYTSKQTIELISFYEKKGRKIVDEFAHDGKEYVIMIGKLDHIKRIHYERKEQIGSWFELNTLGLRIHCPPQKAPRANAPSKNTQTVCLIIEHPTEEKFLLVEQLGADWVHFCGGGIEEGEDILQAGLREMEEETGYYNIGVTAIIGENAMIDFYHPTKNINYINKDSCIYVKLQSLDQKNISEKEKKTVRPMWIKKNDVKSSFKGGGDLHKFRWNRFINNEEDSNNVDNKYILEANQKAFQTSTYLRECDTLDTFMCSSFYFLRYLDPANISQLISHEAAKNMPVDLYIGGKEHAVGHLIYSRFIYKFLQKYGYIDTKAKEPFQKLIHQGMVHAADGRKFSKRRGNGVNPLDVVKEHNTDTLRTYLAFMGPIELPKNWNPDGVAGVGRFLKRFEKLVEFIHNQSDTNITSIIHQTIKAVGEDMDNLKFNTAISKLMIATNTIYEKGQIDSVLLQNLILLLAPFAPDTAQRMWTAIGQEGDVTKQPWPTYDSQLIHTSTIDLPIQINGKTKGTLSVSKDITQDEAITLVRQDEKMSRYLEGGIKKIIRVPGRICNIIV